MKNIIASLLMLSFTFASSTIVLADEDKPYSENLKKEKEAIEKGIHKTKKDIKSAERLEDKGKVITAKNYEMVLEAESQCFKENEEVAIHICMKKAVKKLADEGNFVAQDNMAGYYSRQSNDPELANDELALKWYYAALKNPNIPPYYKSSILDDVEKLEEKLKGKESKDNKPLSKSLKKQIESIKAFKEFTSKGTITISDKEELSTMKELEETIDSQSTCIEKTEEHDIQICLIEQIKILADKGNYCAQHMLGNIYENRIDNNSMAIQWYKKALENPKITKYYAVEVQRDLDRVQSKEKK